MPRPRLLHPKPLRRLPPGRRYGVVAGTGRLIDALTRFTFGESELAQLAPFLAPEDQAKARALRMKNAESGMRRPVQVMEGNYHLMQGVCPWWDQIKGQAVG